MRNIKRRPDLFMVLAWVASVATVVTLLWILESIVTPAWPAIQQTGLNFFTSTVWDANILRCGRLPDVPVSSGPRLCRTVGQWRALARFRRFVGFNISKCLKIRDRKEKSALQQPVCRQRLKI
jgi:hypothetical protein